MVNAVHAEDSSSASVNSTVCIEKIEWTSVSILKIYLAEGPSFFVRDVYLSSFPPELLTPDSILGEAETETLVHAGRIYLAERSAMEYLARSEQCRFSLSPKLYKKDFTLDEINPALDYLEQRGMLDDARFASAWLRNRSIHQSEGRQKLLAGLLSRGIAGSIARQALDAYFEVMDEKALCKNAAEKMIRIGKKEEKLAIALARKGFSLRIITECLKSIKKQ